MELYEDTKISKIFGTLVKLTMSNGDQISGQIYSYIKDKNLLLGNFLI